jgi:hypothetical protein
MKMIRVNPQGRVEEVDPNDFLMTKEKAAEARNALKRAIRTFTDLRAAPYLKDTQLPGNHIFQAIKRSRVVEMDRKVPGTANNPVASDMWHIGTFGSVWLDVGFGVEIYRVAFYIPNHFVVEQVLEK